MMRSLFSGVSGLKVHQTKMDVIGNNISNVNTIGFKSSTVTFADVFYQTTQNASGPNNATGTTGRNAMQIGLGSNVASITSSITTSGASQRTDNPFDIMIEGDSFFIVNKGGTNYFTKSGSFNIDASGTLCTPFGAAVMGWQVDPNDETKTVADKVSPLTIMSPENLYAEPEATTACYISGNIDSMDTQLNTETGKMVNLTFYDSLGHSYTADMIIRRPDDADGINNYGVQILDIKDESGLSIFVKANKEDDGTVTYTQSDRVTGASLNEETGSVNFDEKTGKVQLSMNAIPLTFNAATGQFSGIGDENSKTVTLTVQAENGPFKAIAIDFSQITMYSSSGSSSLEATRGDLTGNGAGKQVGNMTGVSIDASGKIYGKYDNGDSRLLGQIAVASFSNPAGLEAVGNSMFAATQNSGDFDGIGQDPTQGGGSLTTGVLEMSNVDLSQQFTDMITTQRGFQANSRIITTSDTLLEELINLKR